MVLSDLGGGVGSLVGGIINLGRGESDRAKRMYKQSLQTWQQVWDKIQNANFDYTQLSPPEMQVWAQMSPETYNAFVPPEVQEIAESPELRGVQEETLGQLQQVQREGLPLVDRLQAQGAQQAIAKEARRGQQAILRELAARGRLGGGDELQARMIAGQQQSNLARDMGQDLARESILRKLSAGSQAAQLAGQMRQQDLNPQLANQQAWERYNALVANLRNQAAQSNAAARERAQQYNVGTKQRVGEARELSKYTTDLENINRTNELKQRQLQNLMSAAGGMSGAYQNMGNLYQRQHQQKGQGIMQTAQGLGKTAGSIAGMFTGFGG